MIEEEKAMFQETKTPNKPLPMTFVCSRIFFKL